VQIQSGCHRFAETIERDVLVRLLLIGPRPVSAVDGAFRIQKESRKSQIVIELEQREIERIALNEAHADKLIQQVLKFWIVTNNLFVKALAGNSRDAPQYNQERLAGCLRLVKSLGEIVVNPEPGRLNVRAVIAHPGVTAFGRMNANSQSKKTNRCSD